MPKYYDSDLSFWYNINLEVSDDILIRVKHFENNDVRKPLFRIMFNINFAFDNVIRFFKRDIDLAANVEVSENFFIDIIID